MDLRKFLKIDDALNKRLMKAWKAQAATVHADVTQLIRQDRFQDAYALAESLNMRSVAEKNREWIEFTLRQAAMFGAKVITPKPVTQVGKFQSMFDHVTETFIKTVEYNVSRHARTKLLQLIAQAQHPDQVKKAETARFVKDFVSFKKEGDSMLQLISSLHSTRMAVWGFSGEAQVRGVTQYRLTAVLDGRTSDFCRMIDGKVFLVSDARNTITSVLSVENPDDVKTLQPWPRQSKAEIARYSAMSGAELTINNLHVPPFHPGCRTLCVEVGKVYVGEPPRDEFKPIPPSRALELSYDKKLTNPVGDEPEKAPVADALRTYTTGLYQQINGVMRTLAAGKEYVWPQLSNVSKDEILEAITHIGKHLAEPTTRLLHDVVAYRGIDATSLYTRAGIDPFGLDDPDPLKLVGMEFEDPGFMSFSYSLGIARNFGNATLMLKARKGEQGWQDMREVSTLTEEDEILRKGGRFKITGYDTQKKTLIVEAVE